jgi:hypothetical protein
MRRRNLIGGMLGSLALLAPRVGRAALESINVQFGQTVGVFYPFPAGRGNVVPWATTSTDFPDSRGLMSADRTTFLLADPGSYLVNWNLTWEPGPGNDRKTSLEVWDADDQAWHAGGDGNELPPTRGKLETTCLGVTWVRSDGRTKIRVLAGHDLDKPLKISDRSYECGWHVAKWPG